MSKDIKVIKLRVTSVDGNNNNLPFSVEGFGGGGGNGVGSDSHENCVRKTGDIMTGSLTAPVISTSKIIAERPFVDEDVDSEPAQTPRIDIEDEAHFSSDVDFHSNVNFNPEMIPGIYLRFANEDIYHGLNSNNNHTDWISRKNTSSQYVVNEYVVSNDFTEGLTGRGMGIKKDANGKWIIEIDGAIYRDFIEAPEFRFNSISVTLDEDWRTPGLGLIESVDTEIKIITVKLLEGEYMSSKVGDICRGKFHNILGTESGNDSNGFLRTRGFATSYFTPTEILPDGKSFRYELQAGTTFHPCKAMKFAVYGNFTDKTRQATAYSTRTYIRYLSCVDTWSINPDKHIVAQYGDIDGLTIGGVTMRGTGSYQKNSYLSGVQIQFTPEQKEELKGDDAYNVSLSSYEGVIKISSDGIIASTQQEYNVVNGTNNIVTDGSNLVTTSYTLSTRIQAYKGQEELIFGSTPSKGNYIVGIKNIGCSVLMSGGVLYILSIEDKESAYVDLTVNCEGNVVFEKHYSVTVVANGDKGDDGEDAITAVIYSTNGNCFVNGIISTILKVAILKGIEDITDSFASNRFNWLRTSDNPDTDIVWNEQHEGVGAQIEINENDVYKKALFDCEII